MSCCFKFRKKTDSKSPRVVKAGTKTLLSQIPLLDPIFLEV